MGFRLTNYVQTLIDQINAFKKDGSIKKPDRSFLANAPIELKLLSVQFEKLVRQVQSTQKKLEESNLDLTHHVNLRTRTLNQRNQELRALQFLPTLAADSGFFHLEARIHRAFQNFKIYVGVATTFVSGKCSFLLKAEGASTRLRASKLNNADIRSNKPAS